MNREAAGLGEQTVAETREEGRCPAQHRLFDQFVTSFTWSKTGREKERNSEEESGKQGGRRGGAKRKRRKGAEMPCGKERGR